MSLDLRSKTGILERLLTLVHMINFGMLVVPLHVRQGFVSYSLAFEWPVIMARGH